MILLGNAAFRLSALGRLPESLEPLRESLVRIAKLKDWQQAAIAASNLSDLELTLGEVAGAVGYAEQSVTYADGSAVADWQNFITTRATQANALHQAGRGAEAGTRFREAEQIQQEMQPAYPLLYSAAGFRYCNLLLAAPERAAWRAALKRSAISDQRSALVGRCQEVTTRAAQTLEWATAQDWLLDTALDHLTLGRAALYAAILENSDLRLLTFNLSHIDAAVSGLRRAGTQYMIPFGLLSRAWLRFLEGALIGPDSAQADLDEAWEIAERGPMRLHMADIHLYRARLFFREESYPWESPQKDLAEARRLIEQCGYWRRKEELEDAELAILGKPAK